MGAYYFSSQITFSMNLSCAFDRSVFLCTCSNVYVCDNVLMCAVMVGIYHRNEVSKHNGFTRNLLIKLAKTKIKACYGIGICYEDISVKLFHLVSQLDKSDDY